MFHRNRKIAEKDSKAGYPEVEEKNRPSLLCLADKSAKCVYVQIKGGGARAR